MSKVTTKTHQDLDKKPVLEKPFVFNIMMVMLLVIALVFYMYIRNGLEGYTSRNISLEEANSQLQQELVYLNSELNDISRPGQIQKIAKEKLGMVNSTPQADVIFISKK